MNHSLLRMPRPIGRTGTDENRCVSLSSPALQFIDNTEVETVKVLRPSVSLLMAVRVWLLSWTCASPAAVGVWVVMVMALISVIKGVA